MKDVVIVGALRTAIGCFQGALARHSAVDLGSVVVKALVERSGIAAHEVDEVILGQVLTAGAGQNPARQAALKGGLPNTVSAITINDVCGSGLKALHLATQAIQCGEADVVIADLPCSGLGIIGRKPDIKYNASMDGIRDLAALQRQMLSVVWQYVKPGGVLVYSTCTVNRLENDENRAWFLNEYPFEPVDISGRLGIDFQEDSLKEGYIQLYPGVHPCDGFFISVMKRKG